MLAPRDEADVAEIVAAAGDPLEIVAGGSKRVIGRPAVGEPLELAALSGIIEYEPRELVLTARAATPLDEIERALAAHAQRLAFEPPDWRRLLETGGRATLGGVLAANLSGSRRIVAGAARDHFLGLRAVSGRAERFKAGGRVVKNVTGYDLAKLLSGSWGTLAVLTEVTVRVHPAPEHEWTLRLPMTLVTGAVEMMSKALGSACDVSAAAFVPGEGVSLRLEGWRASVAARATTLLEQLGRGDGERLEDEDSRALWRGVGAVDRLARWPVVWRLSVPPGDAPGLIERLRPSEYLLDWGGGLVWMGAERADVDRVRDALADGHATLIKAPASVRAASAVFQPPPAALARTVARLKAAFDPAGKLNPGRMD